MGFSLYKDLSEYLPEWGQLMVISVYMAHPVPATLVKQYPHYVDTKD